ncbi:MAG: lipopolysaccharide biosynthesis protein [Tannerellaceae bacterium]|nr:lipopolysaccharide biosynthesis protein [Tannerellaceae bacterium]
MKGLKEKTAEGLFWGGINSGLQQILGLLFGVILARILTAEDYGLIGMVAVFTGIATHIQEGGFTAALTNRKHITHDDYNAVFWFNIVAGISLYILLYFSAPLIARFYDRPELTAVSRIIFLGFLFSCFGTAQTAWLFKNLKVKERTKIEFISLFLSNVVSIIMALNGMAYWGIAVQITLYVLIGMILKWYYSPWRPTLSFNPAPLKEMFPFSIKLLVTGVFYQISTNIIAVVLGRFYNANQVGYFTQGNKWMNMGKGLISGTIAQVAQPVFSQINTDPERSVAALRKMIRFIAFISFPLMCGFAFIAEDLIRITITDKWLPSVPILQLLCIWGAFSPLYDLYKNMIISQGRSDIYMWSNILFSSLLIVLIWCMASSGIFRMVGVYIAIHFIWLFSWHYFCARIIPIRFIDVLKDISPYMAISLFWVGGCWFLTRPVEPIGLRFILRIILPATGYFFTMKYLNSIIFHEIWTFLKQRLPDKKE